MEDDEVAIMRTVLSSGASYPSRVDSLRTLMERPLPETPTMNDIQFMLEPGKQTQACSPADPAYRLASFEIPEFSAPVTGASPEAQLEHYCRLAEQWQKTRGFPMGWLKKHGAGPSPLQAPQHLL